MEDLPFWSGGSGGGGGGGTPGKSITSVSITDAGELEIKFSDGSTKVVGKVVGDDGKVYVPHIDEHKILTFTIEDEAGEIPDPVDLNPSDEWSGMEDESVTDYIWEPMETSV